jgi:carboxypeptidase PM20D1
MRYFHRIYFLLFFGMLFIYCNFLFKEHSATVGLRGPGKIVNTQVNVPNAALHLAEAIRLPTISAADYYNAETFKKFRDLITDTYPEMTNNLSKTQVGNDALIYKWEGKNKVAPAIILLSHYDVVPVALKEMSHWHYPPFSGLIQNEFIYGRGAIDNKFNVIAILEAINILLKNHFQPSRTIYLILGADEEIGGYKGNAQIAAYFIQHKIPVAYVLDEGLSITQKIIPFIDSPIAAIGVAEKGNLNIKIVSDGNSGHSSIASKHNAIINLCEFLSQLQSHQPKARWNPILDSMFDSLWPSMTSPMKMIFSNRWITQSFIKSQLLKYPMTAALIKTTVTPAIIEGGVKENIVPSRAEAIVNFRLAPGDTIKVVLDYLNSLAKPFNLEIYVYGSNNHEAIPMADIHTSFYTILSQTIRASFPNTIVAPGLMIAGTDSRHYISLTTNIYRFNPVMLSKNDIDGIHGANEKLSIGALNKAIYFYEKLIQGSSS